MLVKEFAVGKKTGSTGDGEQQLVLSRPGGVKYITNVRDWRLLGAFVFVFLSFNKYVNLQLFILIT